VGPRTGVDVLGREKILPVPGFDHRIGRVIVEIKGKTVGEDYIERKRKEER
jgi:hypothetical protein